MADKEERDEQKNSAGGAASEGGESQTGAPAEHPALPKATSKPSPKTCAGKRDSRGRSNSCHGRA